MKKSVIAMVVIGIVIAGSMSVYAYGGRWYNNLNWQGNPMMQQPMMRRGYGAMTGWCPCTNVTQQPGQPATAPQMIAEDKAKEAAETYISQYLPGYNIDKIEKDSWRPVYIVTIKGANNAEMQMFIHGFAGQVMYVFPKTDMPPAQQ
ncbi:hypothetical protein U27_03661 [Candidatus Vecturithrix granuli]|uniref:PepSY domain-containing protein n=1 Tax=Vecturithrix granuli TaxID=1499967 RepID=A0A081BWJ3_VECG1|nr:hypothetical protein U27_03661 [Candidatus Vecturithrix granuli]